jgi:hypothetical protein
VIATVSIRGEGPIRPGATADNALRTSSYEFSILTNCPRMYLLLTRCFTIFAIRRRMVWQQSDLVVALVLYTTNAADNNHPTLKHYSRERNRAGDPGL